VFGFALQAASPPGPIAAASLSREMPSLSESSSSCLQP